MTHTKQEEVEEIWQIVKKDSLASSKIGSPSSYTREKLAAVLHTTRIKALEEAIREIKAKSEKVSPHLWYVSDDLLEDLPRFFLIETEKSE